MTGRTSPRLLAAACALCLLVAGAFSFTQYAGAQTPPERTYTVQHFDTLPQIARAFGVPLDDLMRLNGINHVTHIRIGQVLQLPPKPAPPTPTPSPSPTPAPSAPAPAPSAGAPMSELEAELRALVENYWVEGQYSIAVTDLQTGETISVGGNRLHLPGCTINFLALLEATYALQRGEVTEAAVGDYMARAIYSSDASAARELYRVLGDGDVVAGVERVAARIDGLGMDDTVLDHPPAFGGETLGVSRDNLTTALDMNRALTAFYNLEVVNAASRDSLLQRMTQVKPGLQYLLASGPPEWSMVSHKNGFLPTLSGRWVDSDVGIVRFQRDGETRAYAMTFLSQGVPEKYADIPLGQSVAQATWRFFDARYR